MGKKSIKDLCKAMFCILAVAFSAPLKADERKLPFEAQALLNALGYDLGPVDGKFGKKSKNALSMHYASKENPTTPVLDKDTLNKFTVEDMYNSTNTKVGVCRYANIMPIQN